jgi:hypothetical protein
VDWRVVRRRRRRRDRGRLQSAKRKPEQLAKKPDYIAHQRRPPFTEINPSAENIAVRFARELQAA